ncbi:hypothetical protein ACRRTK_000046 [Alexandromys fortis]
MELSNPGDSRLCLSPSLPTPVKLVTRVCFSTNSCVIFSSFQRLYFAFVTLKNYWHIIPRGPIQRLYISLGVLCKWSLSIALFFLTQFGYQQLGKFPHWSAVQ